MFGNEPPSPYLRGVREESIDGKPAIDGVFMFVKELGHHADGVEFLHGDLRWVTGARVGAIVSGSTIRTEEGQGDDVWRRRFASVPFGSPRTTLAPSWTRQAKIISRRLRRNWRFDLKEGTHHHLSLLHDGMTFGILDDLAGCRVG